MNSSPTSYGESSSSSGLRRHSISNTPTSYNLHSPLYESNRRVEVTTNSSSTINMEQNEFLQIQAWLSPLKPHSRHLDVRNQRLHGVGDWVLERSEFKSWSKGQDGAVNPTLLCYGGQGVGKTYISSLVIDTLHDRTRRQNIVVLCFYCDYQAQKDQSAVNLIGDLLRQIAQGAAEVQREIQSAFNESKWRGGQGCQLPAMLQLFIRVISSIGRVYICVDAVDELLPKNRSEFLGALRQIVQDAPNTRLFLATRPHIRAELSKYLTNGVYPIHIVVDQGDITRYLSHMIDNDGSPNLMTEDLRNEIMKTMLGEVSEMFLLVSLNIEAILGEITLGGREKMLQKVATAGADLGSVYDQTLERIRKQEDGRSNLGMGVLMWVSHAERPLRIDELCHALAVDTETMDLDPGNIRPQETVIGSCLGLVVVDNQTSTLRLIHYTLHEYLSRSDTLPNAHETLAEICLAYLNFERVKRLRADRFLNLQNMPFLEYSSLYWGNHAKMGLSDRAKSLALGLLTRYDNHISATLLCNQTQSCNSPLVTSHGFAGLHCASYFGICEVVAALIEMDGCDVDQRDWKGFTPLGWAAQRGNEAVVGLLLIQDRVNPEKADNAGQTPLWWASSKGHEWVAKLLLARDDVNPDKSNCYGQTPLSAASENGHEALVRLLLTRVEVNPNKPDNYGQTPLLRAVSNADESVVRLLLSRDDVNPDKPDNDGRTLLWWASRSGKTGAVRGLLTRDNVNPNKSDESGQTPLSAAAGNGYEAVVKLLLARDNVDPDKPDNDGRTPLWHASLNANESVVRLLLSRNDVNPDKPDNHGRTLLWWASGSGKTEAVRGLLARPDVDPDKPDSIGRTPLLIASMHGHREIVALLQHRTPITASGRKDRELWKLKVSNTVAQLARAHQTLQSKPQKPDPRFPIFSTGGCRPLPSHATSTDHVWGGSPSNTLESLPPSLGPLPLYPDNDAFYSANNSLPSHATSTDHVWGGSPSNTLESLPPSLGPLPLYPDNDAFYSANNSLPSHATSTDHVWGGSPTDTLAYSPAGINTPAATTSAPLRTKVYCGSSKCSGNSGPHTCSTHSYTCGAPGCTRLTPFKTKQALNRHYELIHLTGRIDCPFPGCEKVGEKGIKGDNLATHLLSKHGLWHNERGAPAGST